MRLSKKILFAIEAVLDIAYNSGGQPVQSRDITRRQCIPRRYLEHALQKLVRQKVLIGVRGPRGGYHLALERRRITIGSIVRAVQGQNQDDKPQAETCESVLGRNVVHPIWDELQETFMKQLDDVTIDDLCSLADKAGINSEALNNMDFTI